MSHAELLARHRKLLPSWVALHDQPIELVDGKGCRVVDGEGATYLDFFAGILTTMIGYNPPEVVEAVRSQAGRMVHTSTLYLIRQQVELAERWPSCRASPTPRCSATRAARPTRWPCCWRPRPSAATRCWPWATATTGARTRPWG